MCGKFRRARIGPQLLAYPEKGARCAYTLGGNIRDD